MCRIQLCLVTGASSGLGMHFAKTLANNGAKVRTFLMSSQVVCRLDLPWPLDLHVRQLMIVYNSPPPGEG